MSDITRKYSASIKGILSISDEGMFVETEESGVVNFADFINDFDGKIVKISINYSEDIENVDNR